MTSPERATDPAPVPAPAPAAAPRRPIAWILVGCGGAIAAFMALVLVIVFGVLKATAAPVNEVRAFLERTGAGDPAGARAHLSAALAREIDEARLREMIERSPDFFRAADTSFIQRKIENDRAILRGTIHARSGATVPCEFQLVREGGGWRISYLSARPGG